MLISKNGIDLICKFEGFSSKPYLCPAGIPTIGFGNTYYEDGTKVTLNDREITKDRAYNLMENIANASFSKGVSNYVAVELNQNQFDALVSFAYNLGLGNLKTSTLLKHINNKEFILASLEFEKWNKSGGKVLNGLTKRRLAEKELFLKGI